MLLLHCQEIISKHSIWQLYKVEFCVQFCEDKTRRKYWSVLLTLALTIWFRTYKVCTWFGCCNFFQKCKKRWSDFVVIIVFKKIFTLVKLQVQKGLILHLCFSLHKNFFWKKITTTKPSANFLSPEPFPNSEVICKLKVLTLSISHWRLNC